MNKIFKIVWNAARGKMMVVNEATSSVQTGKKAAVTVAVVAALAAGTAMAATPVDYIGEGVINGSGGAAYNANGGSVTIADSNFKDWTVHNKADKGTVYGAAVNVAGASSVSLTNVTIENNNAVAAWKTSAVQGVGYRQSGGTLEAQNLTVKGNVADGDTMGGGISLLDISSGTIENLTVSDNSIVNDIGNNNGVAVGAGLSAAYHPVNLTVTNAVFENNTIDSQSAYGGAVYIESYTPGTGSSNIEFDKLTVKGNRAEGSGLGVGGGFAIFQEETQVTIKDSVFEDNTTNDYGGAIYNGGNLTFSGTNTFTGNTAENGNDVYNEGTIYIKDGKTTFNSGIVNDGTLQLSDKAELALGVDTTMTGTLVTKKGSVITLGDDVTLSFNSKTNNSKTAGVVENLIIQGNGHVDITADGIGSALGIGTNTLDVSSVNIDTDGRGITAYGTNTVTADTITINTDSDGIHAMGDANGAVKLTADTISITAGAGSYAIQNASANKKENVVVNGKDVTLTSLGRTAISQQGAGSTVITAENLVIEGFKEGYDSKVNAVNVANGTLNLTGTETVSISNGKGGASTNAIGVESAGTLKVTGGDLTVSGKTNVAGAMLVNADSLSFNETLVSNKGNVSLDVGTLSAASKTKSAVELISSNLVVTADKATFTTDSDYYGIDAKNGSTATIDADVIEASSAYAAVISRSSNVTLGNDESSLVKLEAQGQGYKGEVIGLWAYGADSSILVKGQNLEIVANGDEGVTSYGILAQANLGVDQTGGNSIVIDAQNTHIEADDGILAMSKGKVDVKGNLTVKATDAILVRGESTVNINQDGGKSVVLNGDINFNKNGTTSGTNAWGDVNLNLDTADSVWNGNVKASWDNATATAEDFKNSKLNLTLANGAQWNPQAVESVGSMGEATTFALRRSGPTDEGQFQLGVDNLNMQGGVLNLQDGVVIEVNELDGSGGQINLGTDGGQTGAGLNVGTLSDETKLDVILMNSDLTKELTSDDLTPEQTQELLKNVAGGSANVTTEVQEGMYNDGYTANGKDGVVATKTNSVMSNTLDLASAAPLAMNRLLMNDVRKRMGDLRSAEGTHGVWARYDGGKLSGANGLENDFTTVQVGIDTVPVADAPRFGVAFSYTQSDADMKRGGTEMDAFSLAFYGTKFYDNGMFVDVIGRMATADTDVTVEGQKGTMDNVALSLSGELGWRFDVTEKFYFEPQAELTYTYVNADKLALGSSSYEFDSVDSLMARVGFAAGFKCPSNFGDVYVRASAVHEFLGDSAVTGGNGTIHEVDGEDTWVEFGLGANFNVNKNTYVYVDIERTEGAKLEEDWRANVGVRFAF